MILKEYKDLCDNSSDLIQSVTPDGHFRYVNETWLRILGYKRSEISEMTLFDIIHPEELEHCQGLFMKVMSGEDPGLITTTLITKAGQSIFVEGNVNCHFVNSKPIYTRAILRDITEHMRAEHNLNERVKELECFYAITAMTERPNATFGTIYQGVANLIPQGWQYPNITCARVTIDGDEFKTPNFRETAWKQDSDIIVNGQRIGTVEVFYLGEKPEGAKGPFLEEETNLINSIALQLGVYIRRNQTRKALQESEQNFRNSLDNSPLGVRIISVEGEILYANKALIDLYGYSSLEELKSTPREKSFTPQSYAEHQERRRKRRLGKPASDRFESDIVRKDGEVRHLSVVRGEVFWDGETRLQLICRDITKRKQAEKREKELYQKEATMREELEAEIEKRIIFTRTLVHELKTPLTPMIAASDLIMEEAPDGPLFRLARSIHKGAETLGQRINILIDAAKGEQGILEIVRTETNLLNMLQKIVEDTNPLAVSRNIVLKTKLPASLPNVSVDEDRLRQVIVNFLDNSFKFTPEKGIITLRAKKKADAVIVEVEDTGRGMSADQQKHIFEAAYRFKKENKQGSGLGLGLILSKILVELHGGKIWIESQEDKGSTFSFSIPIDA
ncbi:PAS domain S-box protein [Chloroflexota bacterium]